MRLYRIWRMSSKWPEILGEVNMDAVPVIAMSAAFVIVIALWIIMPRIHRRKIYEKVESMGGKVTVIERRFCSIGPFIAVGKGRTVYRFEYWLNNQRQEGWVKFGTWFGPGWRI